ncbi:ATP-NAD kinase family protein [Thalassotalea euphylliae]|uniref:ATP-NAD kinase n=1 Tax=Thalassotalea euphylliae TaxID=1655234 RepID=A0A3E0UHZ0_9GAMM|nr:ATP-NAD kinase family protein [Thalassotalea euphylliae]REL36233.1 ATP-NAD kinase [Thalassotalea euphylliae]
MKQAFKLGFIVNPIAGIGGSVALKGSDGEGIAQQALQLGATAKANQRAATALSVLKPYQEQIQIFTASGDMGEYCARELGFSITNVYQAPLQSSASDTENTVAALVAEGVDLILFAGGDGTARNICHQIEALQANHNMPVLGIPAGCKIHSGVYAVTPKAAGRIVEMMVTNQLVTLTDADVMDIDESLFRDGVVKAKRYGEMQIPMELRYVQAVKAGGKESDELVLQDIAAHVIDELDDSLAVIGSGSTTAAIMDEMGIDNTLLGVDLVQSETVIASDVTEPELWAFVQQHQATSDEPIKLVITVIGGQGHIFGRGNQQLSPRIIKAVGKDNIIIVATKTKLASLNARPLIADTGDDELDQALAGYLPIVTGYRDQVLYPVASPL